MVARKKERRCVECKRIIVGARIYCSPECRESAEIRRKLIRRTTLKMEEELEY
jgi:predicted nucleic acid-binding Zn ribbon protein